jgi:peptide/nickel transport system substrate-binding protein
MSGAAREALSVKAQRLLAPSLLAAMLLVGMAPHAPASVQARTLAANPPLIIDVSGETATLDPQINYDTAGFPVLGNVYDGLVRAVGERTVGIVPDLATSWTHSPDGKTWTFTLRSGATFHDGTPVDAAAVKFTWDRLFKINQGAASDWIPVYVKDVQALDAATVVFHLKVAWSSFLSSLSSIWGTGIVSPKTVLAHQVHNDLGQKWLYDHDAGSGPWVLTQWVHNQKIVLDPFPNYWRGWSGKHLGRVIVEWPLQSSTQRLGLEHGNVDLATGLSIPDFAAVANDSGITARTYVSQNLSDILFNCTHGPLQNRLVRQALSYTFDYDTMIKAVLKGQGSRMLGIGPTGFINFIPAKHLYTYDLTKAARLLKQAGYANGFALDVAFVQGSDTTALEMAQIWQADALPLGIRMNLRVLTQAENQALSHSPKTEPDIFFGGWTMDYADDAQWYWITYYSRILPPNNSNNMYYKNSTVNTLLEQAAATPDPAKAKAIYAQMAAIVYNDAPNIWTYQGDERIAMRNTLHGYTYNFLYTVFYFDLYALSKG